MRMRGSSLLIAMAVLFAAVVWSIITSKKPAEHLKTTTAPVQLD